MIQIGDCYNRKTQNCAHYVAEFFNVPPPNDEVAFIRWMRRNFEPISKPVDGCLVVAGPPLHVGVFNDYTVKHMQNDCDGGQLSKTEFAMFKQIYKNIRFYKYVNPN